MSDKIEVFSVGPLGTNCYAYISGYEAMVVDPGADGFKIADALVDYEVKVLVATHGHGDHVGGMLKLQQKTHAPFYIAQEDYEMSRLAGHHGPFGMHYDDDAPSTEHFLKDGDVLEVGTAQFEVMSCPGHTPGGIVLKGLKSAQGIAFVGDSLFAGSIGRCDLEGGDFDQLERSLAHLVKTLDLDTKIFPGHGQSTTLRKEISTNPYLISNSYIQS